MSKLKKKTDKELPAPPQYLRCQVTPFTLNHTAASEVPKSIAHGPIRVIRGYDI